MQNKKVVYLDQNFVSNLAKARYLKEWRDPLAPFYRDLNEILSNLTDSDRIICPTSPFHTEESEFSQRVSSFIWHFVEQFGYGLSFKPSPEIWKHQITIAALTYCGLSTNQHSTWIAFNRDPQTPIKKAQVPPLLVSIPPSHDFNEYLRLSRTSIAEQYGIYKEYCKGKRHICHDEVEAQKKQLISEWFSSPPRLNIGPTKLDILLTLSGAVEVIQFHNSVGEILIHSNKPGDFLISPELMNCPFIDIFAFLMAADIFFYPDNKPSSSLRADFEILASVIPYVDILATDGYMVQLISRGRLADRYGVHVFSVRQRQVLVEELRRL